MTRDILSPGVHPAVESRGRPWTKLQHRFASSFEVASSWCKNVRTRCHLQLGLRFEYPPRPPRTCWPSRFPLGRGHESEARTPRLGRFLARRCYTFTRLGRRRYASCCPTCRRRTSTLRCLARLCCPRHRPPRPSQAEGLGPVEEARVTGSSQHKNKANLPAHHSGELQQVADASKRWLAHDSSVDRVNSTWEQLHKSSTCLPEGSDQSEIDRLSLCSRRFSDREFFFFSHMCG